MSEQAGEREAPVVDGYCYGCASHQCEHAHATDPDPDCECPGCGGALGGCLGCLVDGHDHSCGFVAINAPRTTWNTHITPPAVERTEDRA